MTQISECRAAETVNACVCLMLVRSHAAPLTDCCLFLPLRVLLVCQKRSSAVLIIPNRVLQPLQLIMPLMLITVLGINNSLNN